MSLVRRVREACEALGLSLDQARDEAAIRKAYRSRLREHPPDRDPDGFRRIRQAYELLSAPLEPARALLRSPTPLSPPPRPAPVEPAAAGSTAVLLLRDLATRFSLEQLVSDADALAESGEEA